jgi:hypothetical protein
MAKALEKHSPFGPGGLDDDQMRWLEEQAKRAMELKKHNRPIFEALAQETSTIRTIQDAVLAYAEKSFGSSATTPSKCCVFSW